MDCNEARPLLGAAIDRELSAAEALRVEQHLATCAECRRDAQALQAVSQAARTATYFRAPDALRARILAALPATESTSDVATAVAAEAPRAPNRTDAQPSRLDTASAGTSTASPSPEPAKPARPTEPAELFDTRGKRDKGDKRAEGRRGAFGWPWAAGRWPRGSRAGAGAGASTHAGSRYGPRAALGWPIGIVAALALAATVSLVVIRPARTNTAFVDELVASHVRAQLSGHDIDVVSSDQHTVKPWFNGRLDYAPPVEDLADEGFALTGGRLDYIGHRRVGVLVYRYRKHVIDVYVMPETNAGMPRAAALTSDGYALASWRGQGMRWWAVSDAEPAVLARLRTALEARLSRTPSSPPQ